MAEPYGTIAKYRNTLAIKKHNALIQPWASAMAMDIAAVFWATWKGIEERLPEGDDIIEAEKPRDSRDLKNKYSAIIRVEVKRHSAEMQRVVENYIYRVWLAGAVEQCRDLGCTGWFFSSLSKSSTSSESASTSDGTSLQETTKTKSVKADSSGWVSLPNLRAQSYAKKHAAEAVTSINDTTRKEMARIVSDGVKSGSSYNDIAKNIKSKFEEFAVPMPQKHIANRAVLVAVTELANAYCEGNNQVGQHLQDSGLQMMKAWQTLDDDRVSDGCRKNEQAGWIPFKDKFPSGDIHPPRFPGCRCDYLIEMLDEKSLGKSIEDFYSTPVEVPMDNSEGQSSQKYASSAEMYESFKKKYASEMSSVVSSALNKIFEDQLEDPEGWGLEKGETRIPSAYAFLMQTRYIGGDHVLPSIVKAVKNGILSEDEAGRMLILDEYCATPKYQIYNKYLRGLKLLAREKKILQNYPEWSDALKLMVNATKNGDLEKGFTGVRYLHDTPKSLLKMLKQDNVYTDDGFTSISTTEEHLFSKGADVIMHVTVPPGRGRGLYAQALETVYPSNYRVPGDGFKDEQHEGEHEFILAPGTKFRVVKVEDSEKGDNKAKEVWVEVYDE